jgi:hypothetical protein
MGCAVILMNSERLIDSIRPKSLPRSLCYDNADIRVFCNVRHDLIHSSLPGDKAISGFTEASCFRMTLAETTREP